MASTRDLAEEVDAFLETSLLGNDDALSEALARSAQMGLVPHAVSPLQGAFLQVLAKSVSARRILEIGTLGGYSAIWMARALPEDGELISLEVVPTSRAVALQNIASAGLADKVDVRLGQAGDILDEMIAKGVAPFDLIFVDADKRSFPQYWSQSLALSRAGTLIVLDNVVRGGGVIDTTSDDNSVRGVRTALDLIGRTPGVTASAMQTVGAKGHDGFAIAVVEDPNAARA